MKTDCIKLLLFCALLIPGLTAPGCAFKMGGGTPAPAPSELISASIPAGGNSPLPLIKPYDTDQLISDSDCIALGQVREILPTREETQKAGDKVRYIVYTDIIVQVERYFRGGPGERLTIRVEGGKIGNLVMWAEDVPLFAKGEKALFFLHLPSGNMPNPTSTGASPSYYVVTGAVQGKYEIQDDLYVSMTGQSISATELEKRIERRGKK